jgi:diguanylate cyclase (GGDEF)-like protein
MTLRQKILLLGLTAIVSMAFALWRQQAYHAAELEAIETMARNGETMAALSSVAHELQRERGFTTYALAGASPPTIREEEIARTDAALARLDRAGWMPPDFRATLASLRQAVIQGELAPLVARDDFSALVRGLIDEMTRLAREPAAAIAKTEVAAHTHLVAMKEYLGQARATLGYWIANPRDDRRAYDSLARIKVLFDEEQRKFEQEATAELDEAFHERFAGPEVEATLETLLISVTTGQLPSRLDAQSWLAMATVSIDRLFELENRSLALIEDKVNRRIAELRGEMGISLALTLAAALFVAGLTISATVSLLSALQRTLAGMERIAASRDFGSRIPADSSDEIGRIARSFNVLLEIAEGLLREKEYLAATDPLTGISNRLRFGQVLEEESQRKRRNKTPMALVIFDIDRFKRINDNFGHNVGDEVLKRLAQLVAAQIRGTDFFGRWGGEEFILLLRDDGCDAAFATAEKLRKQIAAESFPFVGAITCSFGVTAWEEDDSAPTLVARADQALYLSKQHGRNRSTCDRPRNSSCPGIAACGRSPAPPLALPDAALQRD